MAARSSADGSNHSREAPWPSDVGVGERPAENDPVAVATAAAAEAEERIFEVRKFEVR